MSQPPNQPPQWQGQGQPPYPPPGQHPQQPPPGYYQQPPMQYQYDATRPMPIKQSHPLMTVFAVIGIIVVALVAIGVIASIGNSSKTTTTSTAVVIGTANTTVAGRPTVAAPAQKARIGDTIRADGYALTINGVDRADDFSGIGMGKAKPGYTNLAIDITIASEKDKGVSANQLYCHVRDSDGFSYDLNIAGKSPSLSGGNDLASGDKARGWVTFTVKQNATGLIFEYTPFASSAKFSVQLDQ